MDTIRTEITGESREVDILAGDREIQIREEALEVIEETVAASEEVDFVADGSAGEADFVADESADALYRASPSLAAKNIINLILVLTIW